MPFSSEDTLLLLARPLTHRHLWKCDLAALNRLARTCVLASKALRDTIAQLKKKELARLARIAVCAQLIHTLPVPLCSLDWTNASGKSIKTRVHISYNGRIVVVENNRRPHILPVQAAVELSNSIQVVRATITPDANHTSGSINICTFARMRMPGYHCYMGKRIQTRIFDNTDQLIFLLYLFTRLGGDLWMYNFREEMSNATHLGYMSLPTQQEKEYPLSTRSIAAPRMALFFV